MIRRRALLLPAAASLLPLAGTRAKERSPRARVVGMLGGLRVSSTLTEAFTEGMRALGWRPDDDFVIEARAYGDSVRHGAGLVSELRQAGAEVLVTFSTAIALEAHRAEPGLPIVLLGGAFPVEAGLAHSLASPGGMVTGLTVPAGADVWRQRLELLRLLRPGLRNLVVLWEDRGPDGALALRALRTEADTLRIDLEVIDTPQVADLQAALTALDSRRVDTLFVAGEQDHAQPDSRAMLRQYVEQHRALLATDYRGSRFASGPATLAHAPDRTALGRRAASHVDRILKGAQPGDLPIESGRLELTVNLGLARQLGIELPESILARADKVIR
jgi:putative ABC transport system substrate-binding protein